MSVTQLSPRSEKKRVQLELYEDEIDELNNLVVECGLRNRTDLFDFAIALLKWSAKETRSGREIASIDRDSESFTVIHMPIFDHIRRYAIEAGKDSGPTHRHRTA